MPWAPRAGAISHSCPRGPTQVQGSSLSTFHGASVSNVTSVLKVSHSWNKIHYYDRILENKKFGVRTQAQERLSLVPDSPVDEREREASVIRARAHLATRRDVRRKHTAEIAHQAVCRKVQLKAQAFFIELEEKACSAEHT